MKICFLFGKGVEGCGVTRGAQIFEKWLYQQGHTSLIVDFNNGVSFNRSKNIDWLGEIAIVDKTERASDVKELLRKVNSYDIVIVHSMPTRKQPEYVDRFREFLEKIHDPIIVVHDHGITKTNINMSPQGAEIFSLADVGVVQSHNGYASKAYTSLDRGMSENIIENPIWIDPTDYDVYNQKFSDRRKHFLYLGRMSPIKDPAMIPRIEPYLSDWELSLIGCERSISSISQSADITTGRSPYIPEYLVKTEFWMLNSKTNEYVCNKPNSNHSIKAYDQYKYDWGMEQLGKSFASWCGYRLLDKNEYGHRMEYTMIESFLLTLPVISKEFANEAYSPENKLWKDYSGPLYSQAKEEKELADELNRIYANGDEWNERTAACRSLIRKFNSIDEIAQPFLDFVIRKGKRDNKINFVDEISEFFPSARERRANGEILLTSAKSAFEKIPMTLVDRKQSIVTEKKDTLLEFFS